MDSNNFSKYVHELATLLNDMGKSVEDFSEAINNFTKLVSVTPANTENPNQKSDLEISSRIEVSDAFLDFINKNN